MTTTKTTKTKAGAGKVATLPATDRVSDWRRQRARQRDELDALLAALDATKPDEEASLAALLARAAGDGHSRDVAYSVICEVRTILDAKAGENCEDEIAAMCVRKLDVAMELLERQRATPTAELEAARPTFRAG